MKTRAVTKPFERSDLRTYLESGFKPPSKFGIGLEYERFGIVMRGEGGGTPLPIEGAVSVTAIMEALADRFGWEPRFLEGRLVELARDGTRITLEPGGQMELSGRINRGMDEAAKEMSHYLRDVAAVSAPAGVRWLAIGTHPLASVDEIPWLLKRRYAVMRGYLPARGMHAHQMMKGTCGQQVNLDYASEADAMTKLRVSIGLAAVVAAMFAHSPITDRRPNGYLSERMAVWLDTDADRSGLLPFVFEPAASFDDYIDYALSVPMFFLIRDGDYLPMEGRTFGSFLEHGKDGHRATEEDWITHLTTLFPDVRLKSYLEVRGTDSTPPVLALAHAALWKGILYGGGDVLEAAYAPVAAMTWAERQALRREICDLGLRAEIAGRPLAAVARELVGTAAAGLAAAGASQETAWLAPLQELAERSTTPAEELLRRYAQAANGGLAGVLDQVAVSSL